MDLAKWLSLAGTAVVVGGVPIGLWQYGQAQAWKRAEFAAGEMRAFFADPGVQKALRILDYNAIRIDLGAGEVVVKDATLKEALRIHVRTPEGGSSSRFTPDEVAIRDVFDRLFDHLERFGHFLATGLVRRADLRPYLEYWLRVLGTREGGRKPRDVVEAIWAYAHEYHGDGVRRLFAAYGYDVTPPGAAEPPGGNAPKGPSHAAGLPRR